MIALACATLLVAQDPIQVIVVEPDGRPVTEAEVTFHEDVDAWAHEYDALGLAQGTVRTDADGVVQVPFPAGARSLTLAPRLTDQGGVRYARVETGVRAGRGVRAVLFPEVFHSRTVELTGLDAWPGREPFALYAVAALDGELVVPLGEFRGASKRVEVPALPTDEIGLRLFDRAGRLMTTLRIPTADREPLVAPIPPPCAVEIHVRDRAGRPVPDAEIVRRGRVVRRGDPAGVIRFALPLPPPGQPVALERTDGFLVSSAGFRAVPWTAAEWNGNTGIATVAPMPSPDPRALIVGLDAAPVADARVAFVDLGTTRVARTDRHGFVEFPPAWKAPTSDREWLLEIEPPPGFGLVIASGDRMLEERLDDATLRYADLTRSRLRVRRADGAPAPAAHVVIGIRNRTDWTARLFRSVQLDRNGDAELLLENSVFEFTAVAWSEDGLASIEAIGGRNHELRLDPTRVIRGRVRAADGSVLPIPRGATASLLATSSAKVPPRAFRTLLGEDPVQFSVRVAADGRFAYPLIEGCDEGLLLISGHGGPMLEHAIDLRDGAPAEEVEIRAGR